MASVLIVDDDAATREALAEALGDAGVPVNVASSGAEALRLAEAEHPAAIVVDFLMPGMSGTELIERLREVPGLEQLGAVLATGWIRRPADLGPGTFLLEKPYALEQLLDLLARCGVPAPAAIHHVTS